MPGRAAFSAREQPLTRSGIHYPVHSRARSLSRYLLHHAEAIPRGSSSTAPRASWRAARPGRGDAKRRALTDGQVEHPGFSAWRGASLFFADPTAASQSEACMCPHPAPRGVSSHPMIHGHPVQLLAYHTASFAGTASTARNLAMSARRVTVTTRMLHLAEVRGPSRIKAHLSRVRSYAEWMPPTDGHPDFGESDLC